VFVSLRDRRHSCLFATPCSRPGLISQVAEELWEVKNKKVINLTKQDISIVDYKKQLAKRSQAQIEKARLISKNATKGVI
jgi:ATP-binding cassette subfamily F protein 2